MLRRRGVVAAVEHVHAHRWRHTFAHEWKLAGGDTGDLMLLLGWSSEEMARAATARAPRPSGPARSTPDSGWASMPEQSRLTPGQRSRRARIAAHASWANTADRAARTAAGTKAFCDRFERQVDPDGVLPPEVRQRMARHTRTAYMLQLAERSAAARRARKAAGRTT